MRVNNIFYSIQGEGRFTGTPAVFVRLAGCNLRCSFCDTEFTSFTELTPEEIVERVVSYPACHVVITGGEPTLQLTKELVDQLHREGKFVQLETNGSVEMADDLTAAIDWITVSPKDAPLRIGRLDELKVVLTDPGQDLSVYDSIDVKVRSLQPCDTGDQASNEALTALAVERVKADPRWRLSLQTHKLINIP